MRAHGFRGDERTMKRIRTYGERVLRSRAAPVADPADRAVRALIREMRETLAKSGGVGLAAPQVGVAKAVCLVRDTETDRITAFINPAIVDRGPEEIDQEGCLSFPEVYFSISRSRTVGVSALDEKGRPVEIEASGLAARCFQHELDHLGGVLIIDYASDQEKKFWREKLASLKEARRP